MAVSVKVLKERRTRTSRILIDYTLCQHLEPFLRVRHRRKEISVIEEQRRVIVESLHGNVLLGYNVDIGINV